MSRRRKILIAIVAVPVLVLVAGLLYLWLGNLGWLRAPIEREVGEALGRELTIAGGFHVKALPSPRLVAEDITLSDPDWSDEPAMVHVDRLELAVGLWSLIHRSPLIVRDLQVDGTRVRLETDEEGRANWDFELDEPDEVEEEVEGQRFSFQNIEIRDFALIYRDPSREETLDVAIDRLEAGLDEEQMFALSLDGRVGQLPVRLEGRATSLADLIEGKPLRHDLRGNLGRVEITSSGEIADVATLGGPDLEMRLHGLDLAAVTELLDLPSLGSGSFELTGRARPSPEGVGLTLHADLVDLQVEAHGHADTLIDPQDMELDVKASGADLYAAGFLLGMRNLPRGEFEATARLSSEGTHLTLDRLRARVGGHTASVEGVIRTSTDIIDRELRFEAEGPRLSVFSDLVEEQLAERPYRLTGHFVRVPEGIKIESLEGWVGDVDLRAHGMAEELLSFAGARLHIYWTGPDLSAIRMFSDMTLPPGKFVLEGDLTTTETTVVLDGVEGRAGDTFVSFDGTVSLEEDGVGTDFTARAVGDDPAWLGDLIGFENLPPEPYDVSGRVRFHETGENLDLLRGTYGEISFELDGDLDDLSGRIGGPDLSRMVAFDFPEGLPAAPFDIAGRVRTFDDRYELEGIEATVGDVAIELDGRLGEEPDFEGTDLEFSVRGPDLSALSTYADLPPFPAETFSAAGRLTVESDTYGLHAVAGELGRHRFAVDGTVVPSEDLAGTAVELEIAGPDLADAGRIVDGFGVEDLPPFPGVTYSLAGEVKIDETGYDLPRVIARVADGAARVSGRLGNLPDGHGTDLSIEVRGADASRLEAMAGVALPASPFSLRGRVERDPSGARFHEIVAELGDYRAEIDGALGEPPKLEGTNLDLRASGPDLSLLSDLIDLPPFPDEPFEVSAHFDGSPTHFTMHGFSLRVGRSDLAGEFSVDMRADKPALEGEFHSERFDLAEFFKEEEEDEGEEEEEEPAGEFLLSDEPLDLEDLEELNADVRWTVGEAIDSQAALENIVLGLHLHDGRFTLDPMTAEGDGGTYQGTLALEPVGEGYRLDARVKVEQARLSLLEYSGDPSEIAPVDAELELTGQGRSMHEIAASADGRLVCEQGQGRLDNSVLNTITADPLSKTYVALNPFTQSEPYTRLECSVALIEMNHGVAQVGPVAMRTDKMVMLGRGQIDFSTERLKLDWVTKPRKGVGLSASTITNAYVKLGGTLSDPRIEISPLRAAREAGATVMTGGLWLLYKSVFNRLTAERKVCARARNRIEKRTAKANKKQGR
jgi:uncharacterized protein involved in outer membrane biogenesis